MESDLKNAVGLIEKIAFEVVMLDPKDATGPWHGNDLPGRTSQDMQGDGTRRLVQPCCGPNVRFGNA